MNHPLLVCWPGGGQGGFLFLFSDLSLLLLEFGSVERWPVVHFGDSLAAIQIVSIVAVEINVCIDDNKLS